MSRHSHLPSVAALAVLAMLGACNKGGVTAKNESAEKVAEKVAESGAIAMSPGQWQSTFKIEKFDIDGGNMPMQAKAAMQKSIGAERTSVTCLTPEEAAKPKAGFFNHDSGCTFENFAMAGGRIEGTATCKHGGMTQTMKMAGQYGSDVYQMHVETKSSMPGGMNMNSAMTIVSHRTGACTGKEQG